MIIIMGTISSHLLTPEYRWRGPKKGNLHSTHTLTLLMVGTPVVTSQWLSCCDVALVLWTWWHSISGGNAFATRYAFTHVTYFTTLSRRHHNRTDLMYVTVKKTCEVEWNNLCKGMFFISMFDVKFTSLHMDVYIESIRPYLYHE